MQWLTKSRCASCARPSLGLHVLANMEMQFQLGLFNLGLKPVFLE